MPWMFLLKGLGEEASAKGKLRTARRGLESLSSAPQDVYGDWGTFKQTPKGWRMNFDSPFRDRITHLGTSAKKLGTAYRRGFDPFQTQFQGYEGELAGLQDKVAPGISQLYEAQRNRLEDARARGVSNLRSTMNRRMLAGTPFATGAIGGLEAEFGREAADLRGASFLKEMDMQSKLIESKAKMGVDAAKILETALAGQRQTLGIQRDVATTGLEADLRVLTESMGGAENMRNFLLDVKKTIADLAIAQAELMSGQAQGSGQVFGQQGGRLFGRKSNPFSTRFGTSYNTRSR